MGKRNGKSLFERARDELYSHVIRCDVLAAHVEDRRSWMDETVEYMAGRYPDLSQLQLAQLERIGRRFIEPAIPHGAEAHAANRDDWQGEFGEVQGRELAVAF